MRDDYIAPMRGYEEDYTLKIYHRDIGNSRFTTAFRQGHIEVEIMPQNEMYISIFPAPSNLMLWAYTISIENTRLSDLACMALCHRFGRCDLKTLKGRAAELLEVVEGLVANNHANANSEYRALMEEEE